MRVLQHVSSRSWGGSEHMKGSASREGSQMSKSSRHIGYQWGEPLDVESSFLVRRVGQELEITAAMPSYLASDLPCDLVRQYEIARKNRAKQRTGKDSPHIRFANAD